MFLGGTEDLREQAGRLIATHDVDEPIAIAVAFWGKGAESMLHAGRRFHLICNLAMGGTNPDVIEALMGREGVEVRHLSDLHAKVIVASGGALVSSANFSANGLGLEGCAGEGWREAGVLIPATDPEFVNVFAWFEQQWRASSPVDAIVLERARMAWSQRSAAATLPDTTKLSGDPVTDIVQEPLHDLRESELFQPAIKPRNALRMAADWLVKEYQVMRGGALTASDNFIPAYAAHVLWTLAGHSMKTNLPAIPKFSRPEQVLRRAEEQGQDFPDRTRSLIARLARSTTAPVAVRYWAQRFNESKLA